MIYAVHKQTKEHLICGMAVKRPDSQWDFVEADADGWIEWRRGACPFPKDQPYEVGFIKDGHTISYRPILDDKPQAPEWNGDGLPPVGTVCEIAIDGLEFIEGEVIAYHEDMAWINYGGRHPVRPIGVCKFRPIRTDREKWVDRALNVASPVPPAKMLAGVIHDALKSGELPQP